MASIDEVLKAVEFAKELHSFLLSASLKICKNSLHNPLPTGQNAVFHCYHHASCKIKKKKNAHGSWEMEQRRWIRSVFKQSYPFHWNHSAMELCTIEVLDTFGSFICWRHRYKSIAPGSWTTSTGYNLGSDHLSKHKAQHFHNESSLPLILKIY